VASPAVAGTTEGALSSAGANVAVTLPGSGAATDGYLVIIAKGSVSVSTNALTDWAEALDEAAATGLGVFWYTGTGVPSNPTFVQSGNSRSAWAAYRITGTDRSITPTVGTTATGSSTTPNPPSATVTGGPKDVLAIACFSRGGEIADDDSLVSSFPTNYTDGQVEKSSGTAGTNLAGIIASAARQISAASSEDPGTFTASTGAWRAQTIIVYPRTVVTFERSAAVAATGAIAVSGTFFTIFTATAAVAATGAVASSGEVVHVHSRSAAVSATGSIESSGEFETPAATFERSASVSATGAATVAAFSRDLHRQSAVAASGGIATAGQRDLQRSAAVSATGAVASDGHGILERSSSVSASGAVSSTGQRDLLRAVQVAATGDIFASGQIEGQLTEHNRAAALTATASIETTAVFWTTFERQLSLTATATTSTAGHAVLARSASVEATGAISSTGSLALERAVTVSAVAAIAVTVESQEWTYGPVQGWSYLGGTAAVYAGGTAFNYGPGAGWTYHGGD
jgi:hypothetical protein